MNILEQIVQHKAREVEERKELYPIKLLERSPYFNTKPISLSKYILRPDLSGVIAEFKRHSPSQGYINQFALPERVTLGYMQAGASALSVLTDTRFFKGSCNDLKAVRKVNFAPILRKDFIIDEYQVVEAKSFGADAILLIAEILDKAELNQLFRLATSLGLEVLVELHNPDSLQKIPADAKIVGVNCRNLSDFETNIENAIDLADRLPSNVVKVAESGIKSVNDAAKLLLNGFNGFLIGELFMRAANPAKECRRFMDALYALKKTSCVANSK
ncbi:indole-3-glycerol phosphate synthase TrpC [Tenuifilum thalassicum]|uniref:indole-3-glycerol-phosphate synthase n=1 Tax=Tenuifilum thalassicum TaxID=2590900 RepID=A0A7D4BEE5_9BACT|nr:indole-3-glycerol phosphate synthase TrpC [Tenuifilum thalassicum]QKG80603.1 indole-3-glycerol phosphate synthase TrpC [Tenuifilum thalassicum]